MVVTPQQRTPRQAVSAVKRGDEWFVVFPDHAAAPGVADRLTTGGRVLHASGRPWLVGQWDGSALRVVSVGDGKVALLGFCAVDGDKLEQLALSVSDPARFHAHLREIPGAFHLVATNGDATRVQGTIAGVRRVFQATIEDIAVASDRADVLAQLTAATLDERQLAVRLASPDLPYGFASAPLWHGVTAVPEDSYLYMTSDGRAKATRRWTAPPAHLTVDDASERVRAVLTAAVASRTALDVDLGCDLSGGLDSTTICYLAVDGGRALTTFTSSTGHPSDDDPEWASLAAQWLPSVRRIIAEPAGQPLPFADVLEARPAGDFPFPDIKDRGDIVALASCMLASGAGLHLTGDGGDEVLGGSQAYIHDLVRSRPWAGLSHMRGYHALRRWPWGEQLKFVAGRGDYASWLRQRAEHLAEREVSELKHDAWGPRFNLPSWTTAAAGEAARQIVLNMAQTARSLGRSVGEHGALAAVIQSGQVMRGIGQFATAAGLPLATPFLDDAVVDACLSVRQEERRSPWRYKRLLTAAMAGVVPAAILSRTTKAETTSLVHRGFDTHRDKLLALTDGSKLADLGLIDTSQLRARLSGLCTTDDVRALTRTAGVERWLRDLDEHPFSVLNDH